MDEKRGNYSVRRTCRMNFFHLRQAAVAKKRKADEHDFYCHICCVGFGNAGGLKKHFIARERQTWPGEDAGRHDSQAEENLTPVVEDVSVSVIISDNELDCKHDSEQLSSTHYRCGVSTPRL